MMQKSRKQVYALMLSDWTYA